MSHKQIIEYACTGNYDEVKKALAKVSPMESDAHDIVAQIAVKGRDPALFRISDHHPRALATVFANDPVGFPFLFELYAESGYGFPNGVPEYVWRVVSLDNAKVLTAHGYKPHNENLRDARREVQEHFGYLRPTTDE